MILLLLINHSISHTTAAAPSIQHPTTASPSSSLQIKSASPPSHFSLSLSLPTYNLKQQLVLQKKNWKTNLSHPQNPSNPLLPLPPRSSSLPRASIEACIHTKISLSRKKLTARTRGRAWRTPAEACAIYRKIFMGLDASRRRRPQGATRRASRMSYWLHTPVNTHWQRKLGILSPYCCCCCYSLFLTRVWMYVCIYVWVSTPLIWLSDIVRVREESGSRIAGSGGMCALFSLLFSGKSMWRAVTLGLWKFETRSVGYVVRWIFIGDWMGNRGFIVDWKSRLLGGELIFF